MPIKIPIVKSHLEIQNEIAQKLDEKKKRYVRCIECGEVYKNSIDVIYCGYCGRVRGDYEKQPNGSIIKLTNES